MWSNFNESEVEDVSNADVELREALLKHIQNCSNEELLSLGITAFGTLDGLVDAMRRKIDN